MPIDLVLFDLDETLLATELFRSARHSHGPVDLAEVEGFDSVRLHEGIAESLHALSGIAQVGLVSSSPRWYVDHLLRVHLNQYSFIVNVTFDDVETIKPSPEPLLRALDLARTSADRAIYVGDADVDFEACRAAGVPFVGAGWAEHPTYPASALSARAPHDIVDLVLEHR